jgi:hypothetical protein
VILAQRTEVAPRAHLTYKSAVSVRTNFGVILASWSLFGCGGAPSTGPAAGTSTDQPVAEGGPPGTARWATYHSKRFAMTLRLPGVGEWRVDDRSKPQLVGLHDPTRSRLVAQRWNENEIQNHTTCEARAKEKGLIPGGTLAVVEDATDLKPSGDDVRIWIALEAGATAEAPIHGHAIAIGAHLKRCWAVHYLTEVASAKHEADLSTRLAAIREGTLARVVVEDTLAPTARER